VTTLKESKTEPIVSSITIQKAAGSTRHHHTREEKRGDPIQLYKIMPNIDRVDKRNRFQIINNQVRVHCFKYFKEISKQQYRENFFYNRTTNFWSALPSEIVQAPTVNSFKAGIDCWISRNQSHRLS
jgi:hypothetical protein